MLYLLASQPAAWAAEAPASSTAEAPAVSDAAVPETSWLDRISLAADLRYRFELIDQQDEDLRYRHRLRARVGVFAEIVDGLEAAIQLGTGQSDDPVSNNQTLTEAMSSKPVWLSLAYVSYRPGFAEGLELVAGKFDNRFERVGGSELLWDSDLHPEGIALSYGPRFPMLEPFLNTAAWFLEERDDDDDSWMLGAQTGLKLTWLDGLLYVLAGGGYYQYLHTRNEPVFWDSQDSFGNSHTEVLGESGELSHLAYRTGFQLLEGFAEVGGTISRFPWSVFASAVVNRPAVEHNTGWLVGASFGKAKKALDFALRYIYRVQQRDAVVGLFTDSDFAGGGTNGRGHELHASFRVVDRATTAVTYFYNQRPIDVAEEEVADYHRLQLDFSVEF